MIDNKRDFLNKISIEELVELIGNLLPNMGIKNIKRSSGNSIDAVIDADKAGIFSNCYLIFSRHCQRVILN